MSPYLDSNIPYEYKPKLSFLEYLNKEKVSEVFFDNMHESTYKLTLPYKLGQAFAHDLRSIIFKASTGTAIAAISIEVSGKTAEHQFDILPKLVEPVQEVVLNIRNLFIKFNNSNTKIANLVINRNKSGPVKASDIIVPEDVSVINQDLVLCNLDIGGHLILKLIAVSGLGYVLDNSHLFVPEIQKPFFTIDSQFSPVINCFYNIKTIEYESRQYDEVYFTINTNQCKNPDILLQEALNLKAKISNFFCQESVVAPVKVQEEDSINNRFIDSFAELGSRAKTSLIKNDIRTVGQLREKGLNYLIGLGGIGPVTANEIRDWLLNLGVELSDDNTLGG